MVNEFWKIKAEEVGMYMAPTMEFEIAYSHFLLSAKKRYAGRCMFYKGRPSDEIILKGFEAKRSDSALISRLVQKDVLNLILKERPEQEIRDYIRKVDISTLPFEEIGIPDPMRMPPEAYANPASILHVFYSNRFLGKAFQQDSRPYVFYIKKVKDGLPGTITLETKKGPKVYKVDRIALENEKDLEEWKPYIDWEVQAEKVLENKLEPILTAFGISISEVMSGQKQTTGAQWGW
jgi:DNA polymerase I